MKVIICTENKAKITAVKEVLDKVWTEFEIISEKFSSEVSEQPITEEEGMAGAINRAKNGQLKYPEADYYIGLEGYVDTNKYGMFLAGIVAIINKQGNIGLGSSAKMQLPTFIQTSINNGQELGPLMKDLMNDSKDNIRQYDGTNGIFSKGLYNRVDEFKDATKCALVKFLSPEFFEKIK